MAQHGSGIAWREWGDEAFAEAKTQDKPVLLDIGAVWCHWCHVMDDGIPGDRVHTGTYRDPDVQKFIAEHYIPIKVDNDRRPDINARYNMGGWPTTAFLTADGEVSLYGETYVTPDRMKSLLAYVAKLYESQKGDIEEQAQHMRRERAALESTEAIPADLDPATTANVIGAIKRSYDYVYGGFGKEPKFPHPDALFLILEQYAATGDVELQTIAELTLRGMDSGGMYDQYAGGFFRYSTTRDWSIPHYEKMLEDNAKLTAAYALASVVLDDDGSMDTVCSAHQWLLTEMYDPETGMFAGSQDADTEELYYGEPLDVRATMPTPYIDRTVYANWNALMVSSLCARYRLTGEADILETARKTFAFLNEKMSVADMPGAVGIHHYFLEGKPHGGPGLISDQVDFIAAALDLYETSSDRQFLEIAQYAAVFLQAELEDKNEGGFFDLKPAAGAIGELAKPKKDMGENADAALALIRLSAFTGDPSYRRSAERALRVFAGSYARYGYFASQYARAVEALIKPPLHIVIAGDSAREETQALQRVAWKAIAPGKTVQTSLSAQYPVAAGGSPLAYVCLGPTCLAPAATPDELRERIYEALSGGKPLLSTPSSG